MLAWRPDTFHPAREKHQLVAGFFGWIFGGKVFGGSKIQGAVPSCWNLWFQGRKCIQQKLRIHSIQEPLFVKSIRTWRNEIRITKSKITVAETNIAPETLGVGRWAAFWEGLLAGAILVLGSDHKFHPATIGLIGFWCPPPNSWRLHEVAGKKGNSSN